MTYTQARPQTPLTDGFRDWVTAALARLNITPAAASRAISPGSKLVGAFIGDPWRDIQLSEAALLERYLRRVANERGEELPRIGVNPPAMIGGAHA